MRTLSRRGLCTLGAALLLAACTSAGKGGEEAAATPKDTTPPATTPAETARIQTPRPTPHIDALVPDSARVAPNSVVEVVIRGSGFEPGSPGRNTVELGPIKLNQVPANQAGTEIRFVIPDRYTSNNEAPPRPLMAATYPVTVQTSNGKSNVISIRILP
jgi:hypothetical protein